MSKQHDQLLAKVDAFTDTEFIGLEAWLIAAEVGLYKLSARLLRTSLDLEHYQSVLSPDPEQWSDEQKDSLRAFVAAFEEDVKEFKSSPKIQAREHFRDAADAIFTAIDRIRRRFRGDE